MCVYVYDKCQMLLRLTKLTELNALLLIVGGTTPQHGSPLTALLPWSGWQHKPPSLLYGCSSLLLKHHCTSSQVRSELDVVIGVGRKGKGGECKWEDKQASRPSEEQVHAFTNDVHEKKSTSMITGHAIPPVRLICELICRCAAIELQMNPSQPSEVGSWWHKLRWHSHTALTVHVQNTIPVDVMRCTSSHVCLITHNFFISFAWWQDVKTYNKPAETYNSNLWRKLEEEIGGN